MTDSGELKELQNELEDMGYHIRLYLDEIELYSNLTPGMSRPWRKLMGGSDLDDGQPDRRSGFPGAGEKFF